MGHIHLGRLPQTRAWREVVELIADSASDLDIISASAAAAERSLLAAAKDPVFVEAVRLLLLIPTAAKTTDFADALRAIDVPVRAQPPLFSLIRATSSRLDAVASSLSSRTDLGEIAGRALTGTLSSLVGDRMPTLFEASASDVQTAVAKLSSRIGIAETARTFFARLVGYSLGYWLDRTLSASASTGQSGFSLERRREFETALHQHAFAATRIISEFAPGWTRQQLYRAGTISTQDAAVFGAVALKKTVAELRFRREADG